MFALILAVALVPSHNGHCLDSYLGIGMHQQRPAQEKPGTRAPATVADTVGRIDQVVAPPGVTVGFLYTTTDGGHFFGTRTRAHQTAAAQRYVRDIFVRDGLIPRAQLDGILATQDGNAIIYVPNEVRLFSALGLERQACATGSAAA
ncbi:MAG: hypothetical protein M3R44_06285 [Candidatus Eremiobacteraeota bacterium]|nr:hypothetical protein [Candidatus Eremiobacteraeota bacterium]